VHNLSRPAQADSAPFAAETEVIFRKLLASSVPCRKGFANMGRGRL
jgi:hypothetical protein